MRYFKSILPLTILYIALTTNYELLNWLVGFVLALAVTWLLRPQPSAIHWRQLPVALLSATQLLLYLIWELVLSSIATAHIVIQRDMPLRQGIIALPSGSSSDWVTLLSAQAITLTPGELVVEIDDNIMYTHSLDVIQTAERAPAVQAKRVRLLERIV